MAADSTELAIMVNRRRPWRTVEVHGAGRVLHLTWQARLSQDTTLDANKSTISYTLLVL